MANINIARARGSDPITSHAAADSVTRIRMSQAHILAIITEYGPISDSEIYARLEMKMSPSGARTRRAELVERGFVVDSGSRERLESGRFSILWKASPSRPQGELF